MEFLYEFGLFAVKSILIFGLVVGALIAIILMIAQASGGRKDRPQIEIEKLNERFKSIRQVLQSHLLGKKQFKTFAKQEKKQDKKETEPKPERLFVLDFMGDIQATAVHSLREEISALISIAKPGDEVVLRLESGGGLVTSYGLAASQLARLKPHGIKLTISVDKIAASGGYMMACVADRILAAPFAVLGSIGVVAQVPNFHRLLKRADIDYREITAGEFKRTVSIFGEITEPGLEKFKHQIEETHTLFKSFVSQHRPKVDIAKVATGEHWYGTQALDLGLVDELITSDDYLMQRFEGTDVYNLKFHGKKKWRERLSEAASTSLYSVIVKIWRDIDQSRYGF
jgi:serine protease SohB